MAGVTVLDQICLAIRSRSIAREMALRSSTLSLSCGSAEENQIQLIRPDSRWDQRSGKSFWKASPTNWSCGMLLSSM